MHLETDVSQTGAFSLHSFLSRHSKLPWVFWHTSNSSSQPTFIQSQNLILSCSRENFCDKDLICIRLCQCRFHQVRLVDNPICKGIQKSPLWKFSLYSQSFYECCLELSCIRTYSAILTLVTLTFVNIGAKYAETTTTVFSCTLNVDYDG